MFSAVVNLQFVTFLFTDFVVVVWEIFGLVCHQFCLKMSVDTEETHQRLKAAVHYTVGRLCQKIGEDHRRPFSRQAIAAIAETTFRQCDIFAKDLEAFARHAKRSTVSVDDVKLVARRSTALSIHIQNKSDELTQEHMSLKKKTTAKRKNTETEEESRE